MRLNVPAPSPGFRGGGVLGVMGVETDGVVRLNVPTPSPAGLGVGGYGVIGVGDGWSREA